MTTAGKHAAVKPGDNPFRSGCVDALGYRSPTGETLQAIETRVRDAGFRGALVGPHGHGKSTLMHHLATLDPPSGADRHDVLQVMPDGSSVGSVKQALASDASRLFIDGYDLLPWRLRWALLRRTQVIITSHRKTRFPTLLQFETTPELLGQLIEQLSPEVFGRLGHQEIRALHARHEGNVRNVLRELYDRVAMGEFAP
ncbi:MAG: hypothetical protein AAGA25_16570 [Planctomycetota bacterium]